MSTPFGVKLLNRVIYHRTNSPSTLTFQLFPVADRRFFASSVLNLLNFGEPAATNTSPLKQSKSSKDKGQPEGPSDLTPTKKDKPKRTRSSPSKKKNKRVLNSAAVISYVAEALGPTFLDKYAPKRSILSTTPTSSVEGLLPHQCKKISTNIPTSLYLVDPEVAKKFVELVKEDAGPDFAKDSGPIVELSPGLGILTSELFSTFGFPLITGLEESGKFAKFLLTQRRPDWKDLSKPESTHQDLFVLEKGFPEFPKLHHVDKIDGGSRICNLLAQIKDKSPTSTNLVIFGSLPHVSLIHFIIRCATTRRIFYDEDWGWKDPVYYVALGSKSWWILSSTPSSGLFAYRPSSIVFQLLFKCKVLGELPRSAWIPWGNETTEGKSAKYKARNHYSPEKVFLCRIETNHDVIRQLGREPPNLIQFWYFVRQHLFSRKKAVIPELESWIPGCGERLIRQRFTIYTQFGELSPQQILDVYLQFRSWPEFQACSFASAVEKFQSRLDLQDDEVH